MLRKHLVVLGTIATLAILLVTSPAQASLVVTFDRIDDTTIRVSGSGQLDVAAPSSNAHVLHFDNTFSSPLPGRLNTSILQSSSLSVGSSRFAFTYSISQGFGWQGASSGFYAGTGSGPFAGGSVLSGGFLDLSFASLSGLGNSFAPVGSSGDIIWGQPGNVAGTWTMVDSSIGAVPIPAAAWLFGTALLGLIGFGKRQSSAAR